MKHPVLPLAPLVLICLLATAALAAPPAVLERPGWDGRFVAAGVSGTMVLAKEGEDSVQVYNAARASTRLCPASTFKILNSCIALDTGAAAGPDEVFHWDGVNRQFPAWNKDLTLREAFAASSVPVYQELARRIGEERMRRFVWACGYGNADTSGEIDKFWLNGTLRISALEQVDFLQKLARGRLPFSQKTMAAVKDIMVSETGPDYLIRSKTGWAGSGGAAGNTGWWVGWVERGGDRWYFALNIDMPNLDKAPARQAVVKAILKDERILP